MDIVISDLAQQYALQTEDARRHVPRRSHRRTRDDARDRGDHRRAGHRRVLGCRRPGVRRHQGAGPARSPSPPEMLGLVGPLFAPVNPQDAQSTGFPAVNYGHGRDGRDLAASRSTSPPGSRPTRSSSLSTAAAEVYEDRVGALQVVEPSVLGVQVAYAGYFTPLVIDATGSSQDHQDAHERRADGLPQPASARARPGLGRRRPAASRPSPRPPPQTASEGQARTWTR